MRSADRPAPSRRAALRSTARTTLALALATVLVVALAVGPPSGAATTTVGPFSGFSAELQLTYYGRPFSVTVQGSVGGAFEEGGSDISLSTQFPFPKYPDPPNNLEMSGSLDAGYDPSSGRVTLEGPLIVHGYYNLSSAVGGLFGACGGVLVLVRGSGLV